MASINIKSPIKVITSKTKPTGNLPFGNLAVGKVTEESGDVVKLYANIGEGAEEIVDLTQSVDLSEYATTEQLNQAIQTNVTDKLGKSGGIAQLDSSGKVLSTQLPSYVDDVMEIVAAVQSLTDVPQSGQQSNPPYYVLDDKKLHKIRTDAGESPEKDKIYVVLTSGELPEYPENSCFRWSGTDMIRIGGQDTAQLESDISSLKTWKRNIENIIVYTNGEVIQNNEKLSINFDQRKLNTDPSGTEMDKEFQIPLAVASSDGISSNGKPGLISGNDLYKLNVASSLNGTTIFGATDGFPSDVTQSADKVTINIPYMTASEGSFKDSDSQATYDIPLANGTNAGLLSPSDFNKLKNINDLSNINIVDLKNDNPDYVSGTTYTWTTDNLFNETYGLKQGLNYLTEDSDIYGYCILYGNESQHNIELHFQGILEGTAIKESEADLSSGKNIIFTTDPDTATKIITGGTSIGYQYYPIDEIVTNISLVTDKI